MKKRKTPWASATGKHIRFLVLAALLLPGPLCVTAQFRVSAHLDAGSTHVSEGLFLYSAGFGSYRHGKAEVTAGLQVDLLSPNPNVLSGITIRAGREFTIKNFPFTLRGLYLHNRFSDLLYESDWALLLEVSRVHWLFRLGTNYRTYTYTRDAIEQLGIESNKKIHENRNLMYHVGYNLKPTGHRWNLGLAVTNTDHFIIEQDTNPVFCLHGDYQVKESLSLMMEAWYKTSGALNLSINHFGYFFRTGLLWKIKS